MQFMSDTFLLLSRTVFEIMKQNGAKATFKIITQCLHFLTSS
jgi:hypothetical protein